MMKDTALVVPSIRQDSFTRFLNEWSKTGLFNRVDLILMEDNPTKTFEMDLDNGPLENGDHVHLSWEDIDQYKWASIIPRRSDTVRSFAYWHAWRQGYQYLMTLDDDCYPAKGFEQLDVLHKAMLDRTRWFNTLNNVRPRGVPYYNIGRRSGMINHGIWQGVLDYDAPQQLVNPIPEVYTNDSRIVPWGSYHPFCGMNAMWRRDAMVLSYHLLMGSYKSRLTGSDTTHKYPFDRFGDIWCGIIQKKICDTLHWSVSTGIPYIHHDRASNPFTNLRKEANGIEVNEWFWEAIDQIALGTHWSARECYKAIGESVGQFGQINAEHSAYWDELGSAMVTWSELFTEV